MPFSAPVLTYRAKALASNMCSKVLNGHIILTDTSITTILAPEMTYTPQIIERLEKVEKYSSASKHKVTLVLVSQFRSVNMRFDELDLTYLREFEIFLSQKGNVNNSCNYAAFQYCRLYLIEILHQTTTHCKCIQFTLCCILSKFYIKPQRRASY